MLAALSEKSGAQCAEVLKTLDDGLELVLQCEEIKSIMEEIEIESDRD